MRRLSAPCVDSGVALWIAELTAIPDSIYHHVDDRRQTVQVRVGPPDVLQLPGIGNGYRVRRRGQWAIPARTPARAADGAPDRPYRAKGNADPFVTTKLLRLALVRAGRTSRTTHRSTPRRLTIEGAGHRDPRRAHRLGHAEVARASLDTNHAVARRGTRGFARGQGSLRPRRHVPDGRRRPAQPQRRALWFDKAGPAIGEPA